MKEIDELLERVGKALEHRSYSNVVQALRKVCKKLPHGPLKEELGQRLEVYAQSLVLPVGVAASTETCVSVADAKEELRWKRGCENSILASVSADASTLADCMEIAAHCVSADVSIETWRAYWAKVVKIHGCPEKLRHFFCAFADPDGLQSLVPDFPELADYALRGKLTDEGVVAALHVLQKESRHARALAYVDKALRNGYSIGPKCVLLEKLPTMSRAEIQQQVSGGDDRMCQAKAEGALFFEDIGECVDSDTDADLPDTAKRQKIAEQE